MKRAQMVKGYGARKNSVVDGPTAIESISFDELYDDISDNWREKSRRLQARRWRRIKHQTA